MGSSVYQIMFVFIINGVLTVFIGTLFGILFGLLTSYNIDNIRLCLERVSGIGIFDSAIYFLYNLPSVVKISDIISIAVLPLTL